MQVEVTQRCESPIVTSHKPTKSPKEDSEILMNFGGMNVIRDNKSDSEGSPTGPYVYFKQEPPEEEEEEQRQYTRTHSNSTTSSVNCNRDNPSFGKKKSKKKRKTSKEEIKSVSAELSHATRKLNSILSIKESNIVKFRSSGRDKKRAENDIVKGQFEDAVEPDHHNSGQKQYPNAGAGGLSSPPFGYFSLHPTTLSLHPPSATYHFYPSTPMPQMGVGNNSYSTQHGYRPNPYGGGYHPNPSGMSPYQQRFPGPLNPHRQQQQQQNVQLSPGVATGAMNPTSTVMMQQKIQQQQLHLQHLKQQQAKIQAAANAYPQSRGNEAAAAMYGRNISGATSFPRPGGEEERASNINSNNAGVNPFSRSSTNNSNNAHPFNRSGAVSAMMALAAARDNKNDPAATRALLSRLHAQGQPPSEVASHVQMQQQQHTPQPLMDEMRAFSAAVQQQQQNEHLEQEQFQHRAQKQMKQKYKRERAPGAAAGGVASRNVVEAPSPGAPRDPSPCGPFYVDGEIKPSLLDNDVVNMESFKMLPSVIPDKEKKQPVMEQDITHCDVLLGRGGMTNHHVGNMHFRTLVHKHKMHYVQAKKGDKGMLSKKLTNYVRHKGGRFLQKDDTDGLWYECGDPRAHAKFAQALREGTADLVRQMMEQEEGDVAPSDDWDNRNSWDNSASGHVSPANFSSESAAPHPPNVSRPQAETKQQSPRRVVVEENKPRKTPIKIFEGQPEEKEFKQAVLGMVGLDEERRKRMKVHHVESESESESESEAEDAEYI